MKEPLILVLILLLVLAGTGTVPDRESSRTSGGDSTPLGKETRPCSNPVGISIETTGGAEYLTHFKLSGGNKTVNLTLAGPVGKYMRTPGGILVYTFYPGESRGGEGAFLDCNLSVLWKRKLPALPRGYQNGSIVLVLSDEYEPRGCVYLLNPSNGEEKFRFCPDEYKFYITDVRVIGNELYLAGASLASGDAFIYAVRGRKTRKVFVASAGEHLLGVRVHLIVGDEKIKVIYSLSGWTGNADVSGHCIFWRKSLIKVGCEEHGD